ncbi:hypothetical protein OS493_019161 [Desmophyllum pertusum]|uniref:Gelsolin-like domain-containing protein n=1 Tax=Desmophyllum pertusum TaxID=174260 RepID=A0A9X0CLP5_9CNID|nr:hypothetical protein OS493_019161 [Desmophyllum pertusum]
MVDRSNKNERFEGGKYANQVRSDRGGKPTLEVLDNCVISAIPEELLEIFPEGGEPGTKRPKDKGPDKTDSGAPHFEKVLLRLSDESGQMTFNEVVSGKGVTKSELKSDDVFILDSGKHCFVWIGKGASHEEKRNGLSYAHLNINFASQLIGFSSAGLSEVSAVSSPSANLTLQTMCWHVLGLGLSSFCVLYAFPVFVCPNNRTTLKILKTHFNPSLLSKKERKSMNSTVHSIENEAVCSDAQWKKQRPSAYDSMDMIK